MALQPKIIRFFSFLCFLEALSVFTDKRKSDALAGERDGPYVEVLRCQIPEVLSFKGLGPIWVR